MEGVDIPVGRVVLRLDQVNRQIVSGVTIGSSALPFMEEFMLIHELASVVWAMKRIWTW